MHEWVPCRPPQADAQAWAALSMPLQSHGHDIRQTKNITENSIACLPAHPYTIVEFQDEVFTAAWKADCLSWSKRGVNDRLVQNASVYRVQSNEA
jgi:hypothetical protein